MTIGEFKQLLLELGAPDDAEMLIGIDSESIGSTYYLPYSNKLEVLPSPINNAVQFNKPQPPADRHIRNGEIPKKRK